MMRRGAFEAILSFSHLRASNIVGELIRNAANGPTVPCRDRALRTNERGAGYVACRNEPQFGRFSIGP